eukprot:3244514-Rhodomonas_salina.2
MPGTDMPYGPARRAVLSLVYLRARCYATSGTELAYGATRLLRAVRWSDTLEPGRSVRYPPTPYAMSGTDIAYGRMLRSCYAMSGTDLAYAVPATRDVRTERAYGATHALRGVWY